MLYIRLYIIILTSSRIAFSQSPPFKQFKVNDGLPSPNVYDCMQDNEGYMWFATEHGMSRFDSHSFQNFYKEDGLNSNLILNIVAKGNKLYISNRKAGINIYYDKKISNLNYYEEPGLNLNKIVTHKGNIYKFSMYDLCMIEGDSSIIICSLTLPQFAKKLSFSNIHWLYSFNDDILLVATSDGLYEVKERQLVKLSINGLGNPILYYVTSDEQNNIYASGDNIIYKIYGGAVIKTYKFNFTHEKKIHRMLVDQNGFIWFYVMNEGLFKFDQRNNHLIELNKKLDTEKLHVNIIYKDKKNNVWVCTFGKGVYCFYNTFINNYNTKDGLSNAYINSISGDSSQRIYCGTFDGLSILNQDHFETINTKGFIDVTDYIRFINKVNDRYFIIGYNKIGDNFYNKKYNNVELFYSALKSSILFDDSILISGTWSNSIIITNPFKDYRSNNYSQLYFAVGDTVSSNRINGMLKDSNGKVWIASDQGISLFYDNEIKVIGGNQLNSVFSEVKEDEKGYIWASGEKGLVILKDTTVIYEFLKDENKNVKSFEFDNNNRVWLSTPEGLMGASVQYDDESLILKEEYLLNENAGLVSNDINSLYFDDVGNHLWAGTSNGLSSVDLNEFDKHLNDSLSLRILNISSLDSVYNLNEYISFSDHTTEIAITVSSFDINSTGNIYYEYKLNDEDTVWHRSKENIINFASLAHGDYNFQVRARNNFGKVSEASFIDFTIETPFEKSFFFYILLVVFVVSVTGFAIYRNLKKKYKIESERNTFKNQISKLKQKSLASMMNPHFVFNSLNSIQSFYNYNENEAANEYLAKFSRLIRMNLDFADKTFIKLSNELERLESYLLLEKMRFDDKLNYKIWVSDDIDPQKTEIPNMVVQPFVENAIWHGILKSQKKGFISINIFHSEIPVEIKKDYKIQYHASLNKDTEKLGSDNLYCLKIEITDNGIGYNEARRNNHSSHVSRGVSVTKERLSILHHYSGSTDLVKISDRSEMPGSETGTLVEIFLTPNIYKTG